MRFSLLSLLFTTAIASPLLVGRDITTPPYPVDRAVSHNSKRDFPKPPNLTYVFTAVLDVKMPIPGPIADDGGSRFTGEVTGGTVTGPALNATIIGGTAYPFVKTDGSATFANNVISGRTNDGVPFLVQDNGVGPGRNQQFTWLNIEIGAPYTYLTSNFILAVLNRNTDGTVITINAYLTNYHP